MSAHTTVQSLTTAIHEARHHVSNALQPLMGELDGHALSLEDRAACLERIKTAMINLKKASEA